MPYAGLKFASYEALKGEIWGEIWGDMPYAGLKFASYEALHEKRREEKRREEDSTSRSCARGSA